MVMPDDQEPSALVVGPVRCEGPVDWRGGLHVGPVRGSDPLHELLFVHIVGVAVGVCQAHAGVHDELGVAQAQVVVAQESALRSRALALLVTPACDRGSIKACMRSEAALNMYIIHPM